MFRRLGMTLMLSALACRGGSNGGDAGPDAPRADRPMSDVTGSLHVDFTVEGCPTLDTTGGELHCRGPAPMTLTFFPVVSPSVTTYAWSFGDGTTSPAETPRHTYSAPGSYAVTLSVLSGDGPGEKRRDDFVVVKAASVGEPCDSNAQCDTDLACLCQPGTKGCPDAFARGLCSRSCPADCGERGVCVDLAISADGDAEANAEPWRKPFCLAGCTKDGDCAPGWRCRDVPTPAGLTAPWTKACFLPAHPRDVGASCRNPAGFLSNSLCMTGVCADLGALGLCSLDCATGMCPPGTACAKFGDGRALCLRSCTVGADCTDPILACEPPGAPGPLGFTITDGGGGGYCAPKRCANNGDCGLTGDCAPASGGHCVRH